jgi:hypothetical protein
MEYVLEKQILIAPELAFTISATVGNTGVNAVSNANSPYYGRKMIFAGEGLGAANNVFANRATVLQKAGDNLACVPAYGVALHNIDVTDGNVETALLVRGFVDTDKLEQTVDANVASALDGKILFMKGDAQ